MEALRECGVAQCDAMRLCLQCSVVGSRCACAVFGPCVAFAGCEGCVRAACSSCSGWVWRHILRSLRDAELDGKDDDCSGAGEVHGPVDLRGATQVPQVAEDGGLWGLLGEPGVCLE